MFIEYLSTMRAAEFGNAVNCFSCLLQILYNKSCLAFRYYFRHSAAVIRDYRSPTAMASFITSRTAPANLWETAGRKHYPESRPFLDH